MTTVRMHHILDDLAISEALYSAVRSIEGAAAKVSSTLKIWASRVEDRRQLAQMNDRMLADIGLSRSDIAIEVNKFFWQK